MRAAHSRASCRCTAKRRFGRRRRLDSRPMAWSSALDRLLLVQIQSEAGISKPPHTAASRACPAREAAALPKPHNRKQPRGAAAVDRSPVRPAATTFQKPLNSSTQLRCSSADGATDQRQQQHVGGQIQAKVEQRVNRLTGQSKRACDPQGIGRGIGARSNRQHASATSPSTISSNAAPGNPASTNVCRYWFSA
jgi:hypothetical protein